MLFWGQWNFAFGCSNYFYMYVKLLAISCSAASHEFSNSWNCSLFLSFWSHLLEIWDFLIHFFFPKYIACKGKTETNGIVGVGLHIQTWPMVRPRYRVPLHQGPCYCVNTPKHAISFSKQIGHLGHLHAQLAIRTKCGFPGGFHVSLDMCVMPGPRAFFDTTHVFLYNPSSHMVAIHVEIADNDGH